MTRLTRCFSLLLFLLEGFSFNAHAQYSAKDFRGAAPLIAIAAEPSPVLIVDQPSPGQLAQGRVVIQYRTENLRIVPVFGTAALQVSPRIGHLHITVDNTPWHWADASNEPIILDNLAAGTHHILVELADATHKVIAGKNLEVIVPAIKKQAVPSSASQKKAGDANVTLNDNALPVAQLSARAVRGPEPVSSIIAEPSAKLIVDAPLADQLALGRVIVQYRAENVRLIPVYGQAAKEVSPRIGHIHVTVDNSPWFWVDASNEPVIIVGMSAGSHTLRIELVDPVGKVLQGDTLSFIVPVQPQSHAVQH